MNDSRIPILVLTGFLGAGKTTLLNRLLRRPEMARTAVIINEFGEIGLDHELVEKSSEDVIEMQGGCLCCTIRGDLSRAIRSLNLRRIKSEVTDFQRLVIETTGLADPAPILHTLMNDPVIEHDFRLEGVVTLIDAVNGPETLDRQAEAQKQAAIADRLILSKADLASQESVAALVDRLRALNPPARLSTVMNGEIDPAELLDIGIWDATTKTAAIERWMGQEEDQPAAHHGHDHHHHDHDHAHDPNRHDARIRAFTLRRSQPIAGGAISLFLDLLTAQRGPDLLRMKGIINVAEEPERPLVVHAVQHVIHAPVELDAWPSADRDTRIVFIVRDIEPKLVEQLFDALATVDAAELLREQAPAEKT